MAAAVVICGALPAAAEPADFQGVIQNTGIDIGTQVDLAVVTRKGLCFGARYSSEIGLQLIDDGAKRRFAFTRPPFRRVIWRHAGGEAGFESLLSLSPEDGFGVIVMGNRKDWPRFELGSALANQARGGCRAD